ncbi:hypothetical protein [Nonomuraea wenchangensis]|uniref:hypothetical protein n=1 Tax=Nonomuraea wenchangensis TaxID=568860 RepID=UPI00332FE30F
MITVLGLDLGTLALAACSVLLVLVLVWFTAAVVSIHRDDRRGIPSDCPGAPRRFRRRMLGTYTRHRQPPTRRKPADRPTAGR